MEEVDVVRLDAVIGILGDGQLGRMSALAGAHFGYKFAVLGPEGRNSPAGQVAWWAGSWGEGYTNHSAIDEFVALVRDSGGVVTYEWENVPLELVQHLIDAGVTVRPGKKILEIAQDRVVEKEFAIGLGIPTVPYVSISDEQDLRFARTKGHFPAILKTRRNGYDGKGQVRVQSARNLDRAWRKLENKPCILEKEIEFVSECSVIVGRQPYSGYPKKVAVIGPIENRHKDGILSSSLYPSRSLSEDTKDQAIRYAQRLAENVYLHGIMAVEFFVTRSGHAMFNEIAPRPHNSGHLTIECCYTSQFALHIQAICNLPFGSTHCHTPGRMQNIIGDDAMFWRRLINEPDAVVHRYGKKEMREGRKMGHVTHRMPS